MQNTTSTHASIDRDRPSVTVVLFRQSESDDTSTRPVNVRARKKSLGALLMRVALALETGFDARHWTIGNRSSGEPVILSGPHCSSATRVSLSHSGPLFAAAASSCDALGVDIEIVRKRRYREIAEFSNWPASTWDKTSGLLSDRFFQLWTLWEAAIKTAGQRRDSDTEPLFAELVKLTTPGQPAAVHLDDWSVQSWRRMDKFWITVIARLDRTPQTALYELKSSQLSNGRPDIHRLDDLGEFGGSFANMAGVRALR